MVGLLGLMALFCRANRPDAPFVWVGRDGVGSLVWTLDRKSQPFESKGPIPYMAMGLPIPINSADARTLATIPGLGPVKSKALVNHRFTHGCFEKIKAIERVHGIGPKTVLKVAPYLRIDGFGDRSCASPLGG